MNAPVFEHVSARTILGEMFDRADIGMALADVKTRRFLRVNAKLCEMTGYAEHDLLNMTAAALTHPDDRAADRETFERFIHGEVDQRVIEKRYIRSNGATIWVHITTTIVQLGGGRYSFGITEDITQRKTAIAALEAAERRKNHFLATLAHELRNPLAAIRNSAQLLKASAIAMPCSSACVTSSIASRAISSISSTTFSTARASRPARSRSTGPTSGSRMSSTRR